MARSRIEMELSTDDKAEFDRLLASGRLTVDGMVVWLEGKGYAISRSSAHRYSQKFEEEARAFRESREVVKALATELGESAVEGQQGRLLVELARSLAYDWMMSLRREGGSVDAKDIAMMGKGIAEMARALRLDQDAEEKARRMAREEAARALDAAEKEAAQAGEKGLTSDRIAQLRRDFLGVRDAG